MQGPASHLLVAYEGEGEFGEARNAFERSLRILDHDPEHTTDYAAALDNFAGLYNNAGQRDIAGQMWLKALDLRQQNGDHSGVTRSFMNLAGLALAQNQKGPVGRINYALAAMHGKHRYRA